MTEIRIRGPLCLSALNPNPALALVSVIVLTTHILGGKIMGAMINDHGL